MKNETVQAVARDNRRLVDAIQQIRAASIRALWTDDDEAFPTSAEGPVVVGSMVAAAKALHLMSTAADQLLGPR